MHSHYDVIIIGGGIVGLSCALACAATDLKVAIIDQKPIKPDYSSNNNLHNNSYDLRVFAINQASQQLFEQLDVFDAMQAMRVTPYHHMHVWDNQLNKNTGIHFDAQSIAKPQLGFIIENKIICQALINKIKQTENIKLLSPIKLNKLLANKHLITDQEKSLSAEIIIGADGANSWLREQLQFPLTQWSYEQHALVTTVTTEKPHAYTARQCFTDKGPLAFLPLPDPYQCSIVWSTAPGYTQHLLQLDQKAFCDTLSQAFDHCLGEITQCEKRLSFPLIMRHAQRYVESGVALIGDAAHTIHPLAGQGANLGLQDAHCLANIILQRQRQNKPLGALKALRAFERERKSHNAAMIAAMEGFKQIFTHDAAFIKMARAHGVNLANQASPIKNMMIDFAMGYSL